MVEDLKTRAARYRASISFLKLTSLTLGGFLLSTSFVYATDLYAYAGNNLPKDLRPIENMIGRKVDGVVWFNDYRYTPESAVGNLGWGVDHIPKGYKLAISIGLAFGQPSADRSHPGAHTLQDVAAGKLDGVYAALGAALVSHGYPAADIRLGWEENGNWYQWQAGKDEAAFHSAFARVYRILHATRGSNFTVWFNPGTGYLSSQQDKDNPGIANYDGVAWDIYASAWAGGFVEPWLWGNSLTGSWGINTLGKWPSPRLPLAVPEFGVGSRGDGHGAPDSTNKHNGGDDGLYMFNALSYFISKQTKFVGYWDYNAGDYNSKISDGSRPHEALAFLQVMGPAAVVKLLKGATLGPTKSSMPAGVHNLIVDLPSGDNAVVMWSDDSRPRTIALDIPASTDVSIAYGDRGRLFRGADWRQGFSFSGALLVLRLTHHGHVSGDGSARG